MNWWAQLEDELGNWLASPEVLRTISAGLRTLAPITALGGRTVVSRHDDVMQVLTASDSFGVAEIYADKMARTTGPFFLGMEDTPQYRREVDVARRAVRSDDARRIGDQVTARAQELVDAARSRGGAFDAVSDYSRLIPLDLVSRYFGVPGPDPDSMKRWMRDIFWEIFLNPDDDTTVSESARASSEKLKPYLVGLIATRKSELSSPGAPDDFVVRLLREQAADPTIDDDMLRRNIGGVIVGAVDTQSKSIAHVVDYLLRHRSAFDSALAAVRAGDDVGLAAHVWEALRFNPHNPALFRRCHADAVIADGTARRTLVKAGTPVLVLTLSAMFDPDALDRPDEFRTDRKRDAYLHFGFGQHTCFGAQINRIVVPAAVKALLTLEGLAYDPAGPGKIEYEGPFPNRMMLRFDVPR